MVSTQILSSTAVFNNNNNNKNKYFWSSKSSYQHSKRCWVISTQMLG